MLYSVNVILGGRVVVSVSDHHADDTAARALARQLLADHAGAVVEVYQGPPSGQVCILTLP